MEQQSYKNHIRWYAPHHFVFYPLMLALFTFAAYQSYANADDRLLWVFMAVVIGVVTWVSFMMRQHYALTLQNRLVLLELRYRYFALTGQRLEPLEAKLSEAQLFALRFAPNDELMELTIKAYAESSSPDKIKRSIKNWKADDRRV
jgi:hypothetical protein